MAGLGHKTWATDEEPSSADFQGYLQDQVIFVFASASARDTALASPDAGMCCYIVASGSVLKYTGSAWEDIGGVVINGDDRGFGNGIGTPAYPLDVIHDLGGSGSSDARMRFPYAGETLVTEIDANNATLLIHNNDVGDAAIILRQGGFDWGIVNDDTDNNLKVFAEGVATPYVNIDTTDIEFGVPLQGAGGADLAIGQGLDVGGDVIPDTDSAHTLGAGSFRWSNIYGDAVNIAGAAVLSGTVTAQHVRPATDNTYDLGSSALRWDDVYATNGTIQTSDERFKSKVKAMKPEAAIDMVRAMARSSITYHRPRRTKHDRSKPEKLHWGFSWQKLFDELGTDHAITVETEDPVDEDGVVSVVPNGARYEEGVAPLALALDHALTTIDEQAATIAAQDARLAALEAAVTKLGGSI